jgi:hypothetical protein
MVFWLLHSLTLKKSVASILSLALYSLHSTLCMNECIFFLTQNECTLIGMSKCNGNIRIYIYGDWNRKRRAVNNNNLEADIV